MLLILYRTARQNATGKTIPLDGAAAVAYNENHGKAGCKLKRKLLIVGAIAVIAAIFVFVLPRVVDRMDHALENIDSALENIAFHTAEFTPGDGFVYFSDVTEPIRLDVNLKAGRQTLDVTMDNGEKLCVRIDKGDTAVFEGEIVYTGEMEIDVPESGAYTMTLSGEHASGDLHYDADLEEDRGTILIDY